MGESSILDLLEMCVGRWLLVGARHHGDLLIGKLVEYDRSTGYISFEDVERNRNGKIDKLYAVVFKEDKIKFIQIPPGLVAKEKEPWARPLSRGAGGRGWRDGTVRGRGRGSSSGGRPPGPGWGSGRKF